MDAALRVGTSGYSYADWRGTVYPEGLPQKEMLAAYARRFDTVELNFSYYRPPEAEHLARMAAIVAPICPDFLFAIKGHRSLTHRIEPTWTDDADRFRDALAPLIEAERLAAVLLQFPHGFHYTLQNRRHLDALLRRLEGLPLACEFRGAEWFHPRLYAGLKARGVTLVAVDEPDLEGLPPPVAIPTAPVAYLRFHGRNRDNWWRGDNASRYDYLYSEAELAEWRGRIAPLRRATRIVFCYFNNHWRGQAATNAAMWRRLLGDDGAGGDDGAAKRAAPERDGDDARRDAS